MEKQLQVILEALKNADRKAASLRRMHPDKTLCVGFGYIQGGIEQAIEATKDFLKEQKERDKDVSDRG